MFDFFDFFGFEDEDLKFFIWGRKIEDEVYWREDRGDPEEKIREYLQKCADLREKHLDPDDLTEVEEYYTKKIHPLFEKYFVSDPIYQAIYI